jgi:hypothetical protein
MSLFAMIADVLTDYSTIGGRHDSLRKAGSRSLQNPIYVLFRSCAFFHCIQYWQSLARNTVQTLLKERWFLFRIISVAVCSLLYAG